MYIYWKLFIWKTAITDLDNYDIQYQNVQRNAFFFLLSIFLYSIFVCILLTYKKVFILTFFIYCYSNSLCQIYFFSCGDAKRSLAKLCSLNADKPFPIYTQDGCIDIKYVSGENGEDDDISFFTATYSSLPYSNARDLWWVKKKANFSNYLSFLQKNLFIIDWRLITNSRERN